jgi:hypothetical protein
MDVTAEMILTSLGTSLPLDRRRKDALAAWARAAAGDAKSKPGWLMRQYGLKEYEAKDLLKGNASEAVWERIVKHKNGGWQVVIPVLGAVIGQSLDAFIASEIEDIRHERSQLEELERRAQGRLARLRRAGALGSDRTVLGDQKDRSSARPGG